MDNLSEKIKQLRNEYSDSDFLIEHLDKNPVKQFTKWLDDACLLYTSPSPRDKRQSRMPSSA